MEIKRDDPNRRKSFRARVMDATVLAPKQKQSTGVARCGARKALLR